MSAPTEAEIRDAVAPTFVDNGRLNVAGELADAFNVAGRGLEALYDLAELRQSEIDALHATIHELIEPIQARAIAECQEAVVAAGLRFAAEHPDAPRA